MEFTKMHGLGNDFICMKYDESMRYNLKIFAKFVCDRHYGIGADGLILICKSNIADVKMRIFNKDGSEAQMCGNGIRCMAKYVYDKKIVNKEKIVIETLSGLKSVEYILENGKIMEMKVNVGKPILTAKMIPIFLPYSNNLYKYNSNTQKNNETCEINENYKNNKDDKEKLIKVLFKIKDKEYIGSCLSIGNPHTVIEVEDVKNVDVQRVGRIIENYKYFPSKTNVEFVQIINENNIKVRVWERGVGETLACGSGSVCSAYACYLNKKVTNKIKVELLGGSLDIEIDENTDNICLIGNATYVYEGKIDL